jgi:hypothetical protein
MVKDLVCGADVNEARSMLKLEALQSGFSEVPEGRDKIGSKKGPRKAGLFVEEPTRLSTIPSAASSQHRRQ